MSDYRDRVPGYVEISHFRAPYKNVYVSGFGAAPVLYEDLIEKDSRGYLVLKKGVKEAVFELLKKHSAAPVPVQQGNVSAISIEKGGTGALDWVKKAADGKFVFMSPASLTIIVNLAQTQLPYPPTVVWAIDSKIDDAAMTAKVAVLLAEPGTFITPKTAIKPLLIGTASAVASFALVALGRVVLKV